jgi:hypothetical protein
VLVAPLYLITHQPPTYHYHSFNQQCRCFPPSPLALCSLLRASPVRNSDRFFCIRSDSPQAPVKRSDHAVDVKGWYKKPYDDKPKYDDSYKYDASYKYDDKPKYDDKYGWKEPPKYSCHLPSKEISWYGEYYKWACMSDPRRISVSSLNLSSRWLLPQGLGVQGVQAREVGRQVRLQVRLRR